MKEAVVRKDDSGKAILCELEQIVKAKGILHPRDVVTRARAKDSALHDHFTWEDGEAAEKWRLEEARRVIRYYHIDMPDSEEPVRQYVSITSDRISGGGYRPIVSVLNDKDRYRQLLAMAAAEVRVLQKKYECLKKVGPMIGRLANQIERLEKK